MHIHNVYVCVCVHTCDCRSWLDGGIDDLLLGHVCVCTPVLSRVVDCDSDGYARAPACVCV